MANGADRPGGEPGRNLAADRTSPPTRGSTLGPEGGILAGQVVDNVNHRAPPTHIQVTELGNAPAGAAPIEVAADGLGYFTIQGLKPGKRYQLVARARDGRRVLAGSVFAVPPNPKILISLAEDQATLPGKTPSRTPSSPEDNQAKPPSHPGGHEERPAKEKDQAWAPGHRSLENGGVRTGGVGAELRPPQAAPNEPRSNPNVTNIPAQLGSNPLLAKPDGRPPITEVTVPVPFCDLTGNSLFNFALYDLKGQPWEYRKDRTGRLVLLDFWETRCIPCQHAISHLRILQERFGPFGLEIIGISYESGSPEEKVQKVNRVRQRLGINYRSLLGGEFVQCPVRNQFGITAFPTLVLVDENGRIIWRVQGLNPGAMAELEQLLKQRLGVR